MQVHDESDTACGLHAKVYTAVAIWEPDDRLEYIRTIAKNNRNDFFVIGIGTQSPGKAIVQEENSHKWKDPAWRGATDERIASLQDLRALRYVLCRGGEFCFDPDDVRDAIARKPLFDTQTPPTQLRAYVEAIPEQWRTPMPNFEDHHAVNGVAKGAELEQTLMAAKVVLSCVTEGFVPWSMNELEEWQPFLTLVDRHAGDVFNAILKMSQKEYDSIAPYARGFRVHMEELGSLHLHRLRQVVLVHPLPGHTYATCLDVADLQSGFPDKLLSQDNMAPLILVDKYKGAKSWVAHANDQFHELVDTLDSSGGKSMRHRVSELTQQRVSELTRHRVSALACAWLAKNSRLSDVAAVLGGDDWPEIGSCVEAGENLRHTGVIALSGRQQGLALVTQCETVLRLLAKQHFAGWELNNDEEGGAEDDQQIVEKQVGSLVHENTCYGRLYGQYNDGKVMRELLLGNKSYLLPERWLRLFMDDYFKVRSAPRSVLPVGVLLVHPKSGRLPMYTDDRLCGLEVSLRREYDIVVVEPVAVPPRGSMAVFHV